MALFLRFARRALDALGDVCSEWVTFNEPNVYATAGYVLGDFPPGRRGDTRAAIRVQANMARAHAAAYRLIHERVPGAFVSWVQHLLTFEPYRPAHAGDRWTAGSATACSTPLPGAGRATGAPQGHRAYASTCRR